ncbi:hypothetical protein ACET3Z_018280 [Daucus carota]
MNVNLNVSDCGKKVNDMDVPGGSSQTLPRDNSCSTKSPPPKPVKPSSAKRHSSPSSLDDSDRSATPTPGFRNLKIVDEIDMIKGNVSTSDPDGFQLSKSQKKRLKKQGKLPSPSS